LKKVFEFVFYYNAWVGEVRNIIFKGCLILLLEVNQTKKHIFVEEMQKQFNV